MEIRVIFTRDMVFQGRQTQRVLKKYWKWCNQGFGQLKREKDRQPESVSLEIPKDRLIGPVCINCPFQQLLKSLVLQAKLKKLNRFVQLNDDEIGTVLADKNRRYM